MNLFEQAAWDEGYQTEKFQLPPPQDAVRNWMENWAPRTQGRCLEIGCFPGHYLALMGEKGFELNGVDLTPRAENELPAWLKSKGYKVGNVSRGDFFKFSDSEKFNLVYSNGFIEHFENWPEVITKHAELVKLGGALMISAPNFKGAAQKFLHLLMDKENYDRHYIPSMDPQKWKEVLAAQGFEIKFSGYFGGFDFWNGKQKRGLFQKGCLFLTRATLPMLKKIFSKNSASYSAYFGVVAVKR